VQGDALFTLYNIRDILGYFDRFLKGNHICMYMVKLNEIVQVDLGAGCCEIRFICM